MLKLFKFDKIINGKYVILDNATLFSYIWDSDINLSEHSDKKASIIKRFPYLKRNYRYFEKYYDICVLDDDKEKNKFLNKILDDVDVKDFYEILSIYKETKKKGNIINNKNYYITGYKVNLNKLDNFLQILKRNNVKGFFVIDLNVYNTYTFIAEVIDYFIDIVLQGIGTNDKRITSYISSAGININNIKTNMLGDEDYFNEISKIMNEDVFIKYFKLLVWQKIDTLGRVYINFYMITKEVKDLHVNMYPVVKDKKVVLERNDDFKAVPYVKLNKFQQKLNTISYNFWNLFNNYYYVNDNIDIIYSSYTDLLYKLINKNAR